MTGFKDSSPLQNSPDLARLYQLVLEYYRIMDGAEVKWTMKGLEEKTWEVWSVREEG